MLECESLDFVDVITDVSSHSRFVKLAAVRGLPVICQKPMSVTLEESDLMVGLCREARVPFFIHENWRWQTPIRELKKKLDEGVIGKPFRARISFCSSFPVFDNQPFLKDLEQFILTDVGSHILDAGRFLFGEVAELFCRIHRINLGIKGNASLLAAMRGEAEAETTGEDNLKTVKLVFASYQSARTGQSIKMMPMPKND